MMINVSVIVPNYNHAQFLQQRIESIVNQTYQNFEIIILDDCSTDKSREIIEQYRSHPKVSHIIYNKQNGGTSYKQWYKGIEFARGNLIWIAESDDLSDHRFLEVALQAFKNESISLVTVGTKYFKSEDEIVIPELKGIVEYIDGNNFISVQMITGNKMPNASMVLFDRKAYNKVKDKGYKEFKLSGDYFLWVQLIMNNQIAIIPDILNYCRKHKDNTTNRYRSLGYDFIEGMKVFSECKKITKHKFKRKLVYLKWIDYYRVFKPEFKKGIDRKVKWKILLEEPVLLLYLSYKQFKNRLKALYESVNV